MGTNKRIVATGIILSFITFFFILLYPVTPYDVEVPYVPSGTVHCSSTSFYTTFPAPTAVSSNAVLGYGYTFYYSNVVVINGLTCTVKGSMSCVVLTRRVSENMMIGTKGKEAI